VNAPLRHALGDLVAMTVRRRVETAAVGLGLLLVLLARVLVPAAPPLYDGVVINEPYRWLQPPPGGRGGAQGVTSTAALEGGGSPLIALATPEQPPQAQVFAPPAALILPAGTTSLLLSIMPVPPEGTPADGQIAGNVYRISIANQDGVPATAPADAYVSVVMRGPDNVLEATMERYANGAWQPLETSHAGYTSGFLSIVTQFGDFALVAPTGAASSSPATAAPSVGASPSPGSGTPGGGGAGPLVPLFLGAAAVIVVGAAVFVYRSSTRPRPPPRRADRRRR